MPDCQNRQLWHFESDLSLAVWTDGGYCQNDGFNGFLDESNPGGGSYSGLNRQLLSEMARIDHFVDP